MADTYAELINANSGMCMGVLGGVMQEGQPIVQWPCENHPDQYWSYMQQDGTYVITNLANPSYCLSISGPNEGWQLVIVDCEGYPNIYEYWTDSSFVESNGAWMHVLTNNGSGYVAAVDSARTDQGASVLQWVNQVSGTSHPEQQWYY